MPAPSVLPASPSRPLTTHALCQLAGVTRGTLRLYESAGLLATPRRSASGYRHYAADSVARLAAIRGLKEVGFSLKEIALLLAEHDRGGLDPQRLRELAREQVAQVDLRIARLQMVRSYVAAVADGDVARVDDPQCSFLAEFLMAGPTAVAKPREAPPRAARPHPLHRPDAPGARTLPSSVARD